MLCTYISKNYDSKNLSQPFIYTHNIVIYNVVLGGGGEGGHVHIVDVVHDAMPHAIYSVYYLLWPIFSSNFTIFIICVCSKVVPHFMDIFLCYRCATPPLNTCSRLGDTWLIGRA